jgi:hypothetical protein
MLKINPDNIYDIKNQYYTEIKIWFGMSDKDKDETDGKENKLLKQSIEHKDREKYCKMICYLNDNFKNIITGSFHNIKTINDEFMNTFKDQVDEYLYGKDEKEKKKTDFGYFKWRMTEYYKQFFALEVKNDPKYNGFNIGRWLTKILNVKVCPYCNHNYTFTINQEIVDENDDSEPFKILSRPQFDHFHSKSNNPLLALSFYNLVPCCAVCNTIKKDRIITFSPYDDKNTETYTLSINSEGEENPSKWMTGRGKISIKIKHTYDGVTDTLEDDIKNNIKQLGLNKIYDEHIDYVEEIVDKIYAYNKDYYTAMSDDFKGLGKSPDEIDTIIWNAYLQENGRRPMSKLTTDILKQFKLI